jgi:tRNA-2-methylthio-N6-dimethylallyladenosine synthase
MNVHDSEKVRGVLVARGYEQVTSPDDAGLVLYNTCSIRDKAEQKVFSRLANFRKRHAGKTIGVLGCVAQHNGEDIFEQAPHVDFVCGSASYNALPALMDRVEAGETRVSGLDIDTDETFDAPRTERDNPYSAYITIIEGCDKACTYCVVPFTRGPERSRASDAIMTEARELASRGYTEITLLGQTVNSYRDASGEGWNFARLLDEVGLVDGIRRVRFTTSHPSDFTPDIVEAIDRNESLCDWVHLPVQSGSTSVLRQMRRTYSREEYLRCIETIKRAKRNIELSTDIIVGFPGETEADFEQTLSLLDEIEYGSLFSFKYSPRKGTVAADYDQVPEEEKKARLAILQERQRRIQIRRNAELIGRQEEAIVEGRREKFQQWIGRTTQNRVLNFGDPQGLAGERDLRGSYCKVRVTSSGPNSLVGELIAAETAPAFNGFRVLQ